MIAWFICPYKRWVRGGTPTRYPAINDFTPQIRADGGKWSESEVLGNVAIVKVDASLFTLDTIATTKGFYRLPKVNLDDPLSTITNSEAIKINDQLQLMGYTKTEITTALGNDIKTKTMGSVLRFATTRRLKPRYDPITDSIILDGPVQICKSVDSVNLEV